MAFMNWNERFSVNVDEIDEQHKKLIEMVSHFYDSINEDATAALGNLLYSVADYVTYHFSTEEKYMEMYDYPEFEKHRKEHLMFTEKVLEVKDRYDQGAQVITLELTSFLRDWIVNHVMGVDKKYSDFFNKNGLY